MNYIPSIFSKSRDPWFRDLEKIWPSFWGDKFFENSGTHGFPIDVEEQDDKYVIHADLPGVKKEDVNITLDGNQLLVQVSQTEKSEKKDKNFLVCERCCRSMSRALALADINEESEVSAELNNGVLTINVQKQPEKKTKKIVVK
ncbi:MAG TPA: Hsp20/alpha crystallin family protein [Oligoflexia bacterium]|nr:Hsp20/alpha crystallin family protein [Oligoflexia bacterium]HMP27369.1 Hsp20/alpha crystallin family protein [Oligoflexia bacterium]